MFKGSTGRHGRTGKLLLARKRPRPTEKDGRGQGGGGAPGGSSEGHDGGGPAEPDTSEHDGVSPEDGAGAEQQTGPHDSAAGSAAAADPGDGGGGGESHDGDADGDGSEGVSDEEEAADVKPDYMVTATYIGDRVRTRGPAGWWRFQLEAGAIEGTERVFVFDKCACVLVKPSQ